MEKRRTGDAGRGATAGVQGPPGVAPDGGATGKGQPDDRLPCAICAHTGDESRRLVHLTHGVAVWLCETHAAERFMRAEDGTVFADHLAAMWIATGALTALRAAALRTHVRQTRSAGVARDRPGSYSWPVLRREAEQRFAAGADPRQVIQELRDRHADCPAMAPSPRTMRRWYTQARWLTPSKRSPREARNVRRRRVPGMFALIPHALTQHLQWDYDPRWRGT